LRALAIDVGPLGPLADIALREMALGEVEHSGVKAQALFPSAIFVMKDKYLRLET
jgi:hypothetical protein